MCVELEFSSSPSSFFFFMLIIIIMITSGFGRAAFLASRVKIQAKAEENCCFTFGLRLISLFVLQRPGDDS